MRVRPLVATLLAAIFLDEPLTISFAIGFALVVVGLVLTKPRPQTGTEGGSAPTI